MNSPLLLIAQKSTLEAETLAALARQLASRFGLDAYTVRQRLLGRGLALLAKGERGRLEAIAQLLAEQGVRAQVVAPTPPRFAPPKISGLAVAAEAIHFSCSGKRVTLQRGDAVVGILADLSGALAEKSIKQLLVQNAYRGAEAVQPITDEEVYRTALRSQPVLDLYLLAADRRIRGAVRVFPGRYDPRGLGERATYSGAGNLEALISLVREYAGAWRLHCDFGLDTLPGCALKPAGSEGPLTRENLASLTRYGWLMVDLAALEANAGASQPTEPNPLTTLLGAAGVPELAELAADLTGTQPPPPATRARSEGLPPPPDLTEAQGWDRQRLLRFGGIALGAAAVVLGQGGSGLLGLTWRYGVGSGALPGLAALLCGWGGFYYLRLKRQVENTPTSRARSAAMGMVEIQGRAVRRYAVVSPMSHSPCVWWRVQKFRRDRNDQWRSSGSSSSGPVPFELEDATGRVTVDPRGAAIRSRTRQEGFPGQVSMIFSGSGSDEQREKWVEEILCEGATLYVLGFATAPRSHRPTLSERTLARLRRLKSDPVALGRYDRNGDGRICEEEWEAARAAEEELALHDGLAETGEGSAAPPQTVIGRPPQRALPFLIAESASEAHLARNFALYTVPLFAGALACAIWALAQLFQNVFRA